MPIDPYASHPSESDRFDTDRGRAAGASRAEAFDADAAIDPVGDEEDGVAAFLEEQLRSRPITTLVAAVVTGWIVGKILR